MLHVARRQKDRERPWQGRKRKGSAAMRPSLCRFFLTTGAVVLSCSLYRFCGHNGGTKPCGASRRKPWPDIDRRSSVAPTLHFPADPRQTHVNVLGIPCSTIFARCGNTYRRSCSGAVKAQKWRESGRCDSSSHERHLLGRSRGLGTIGHRRHRAECTASRIRRPVKGERHESLTNHPCPNRGQLCGCGTRKRVAVASFFARYCQHGLSS